jgi:hypothetical protein
LAGLNQREALKAVRAVKAYGQGAAEFAKGPGIPRKKLVFMAAYESILSADTLESSVQGKSS